MSAFARLAGNGQRAAQLIYPFRHPGHTALPFAPWVRCGCEALAIIADLQSQALGQALQAYQQVLGPGMSQHVGDRFLGNAKSRHGHFLRYAGQALLAFQAPVHRGVGQGLEQVCPQTGFQPKAGQLPGIENGGYVTNFGQGFFQRVAEDRALSLELFGHPAFEPVTLQFCGGQQLTDVVMQFAAQSVTLVFLDLQ
ncbi:hypothetical protein D3C78_885850 [compost metagenome]